MPHPVIDAAVAFRQGLINREAARATALINAYGRAYRNLQGQIQALEQQIATLDKPGRAQVTRLASLRSLTAQTADEVNRFAVFADQSIANAVSEEIVGGLRDSRATVEAYFASPQGRAAFRAAWDMLPAETVETMLGYVDEGSPLRTALVNRLGPTVAERMSNALVDAISLGMNPRRTAALVRKELGVGLTWALTTARTAQMWAYREASRLNYMNNSRIVSGWTWLATLDDRVCGSCLSQHGTQYPVTETLNGHHGCRCAMIPNIVEPERLGLSQPAVEPGEEWFKRQSQATQTSILGPGMLNAYNAGAVRFDQLSHEYEDRVYGTMIRASTMIEVLGNRAQDFYHNG